MEDPIYRLTGTFSELQELLQSQFAMEEKAARFSVCLLIMEQHQMVDELSETHTALWYLNRHEHFTTPVFKSRFSISLTDVKKNILDQIFIQFGGILIDGDTLAFTTILNCLLVIYRSGTFIKKEECCVYYQALSWKATHASQEYFQVQDILPSVPENVCRHLDLIKEGKWKCYSCHEENCSATVESFSVILNELCERNVLKKYNNMYRFTK
ncbi:MAG: hypothetical protein HDR20_06890 [Lachnospiraceae bacterium]|nr:hypothetical protein [Lachnospiraceae bacterium]